MGGYFSIESGQHSLLDGGHIACNLATVTCTHVNTIGRRDKMAAEQELGDLCSTLDSVLSEFFATLQELEDLRRNYDAVARDVRAIMIHK